MTSVSSMTITEVHEHWGKYKSQMRQGAMVITIDLNTDRRVFFVPGMLVVVDIAIMPDNRYAIEAWLNNVPAFNMIVFGDFKVLVMEGELPT